MADRASITKFSRRTVLARGAAALPAVAALTAGTAAVGGDAAVMALARLYGQAIQELTGWIDAVETRYGPCAYDTRPDCQPRYAALVAQEDRLADQLAAARPVSVAGLAAKLRAAFWCDDLRDATGDCNTDILLPALHDVERLVGR